MENSRFAVPIDKLRRRTDVRSLGFADTDELGCLKGLIGQERAVRSISFGLSVNSKGYNLFVVGNPGSGRTTYVLEELANRAKEMPAPDDWVYVYNFKEPQEPMAINLPAGMGRELAKDMEETLEDLKVTLSKAFDNSQYEDSKAQLVREFQEQVNSLMEELKDWATEKGFAIKRTPQGFVNLPLVKEVSESGEVSQREMQQEEFEALGEEEQQRLQRVSEEISQRTLEILRQIREREKGLKDRIKSLEAEICRGAIKSHFDELKGTYGSYGSCSQWLDQLAEDVVANFSAFIAAGRDENAEVDFSRYHVNVFVSNDPTQGAPVVRETNPTYYNLIGKVEYESRQGYLYTDFKKIVPGAIHRANGGFLVLEAEELFRHFMSWDALKRVLRTQELSIENLGEQLGFVPVSSLRPAPIPVDLKVVIVGTYWIYYLLNIYDPEFQKIFKIKAHFDSDMPRNPETEKLLACFVANFVKKEGGIPFSSEAVAEIIEWSCRLSENQDRMSTQFNRIAEILVESTAWARMDRAARVERSHVRKAIEEKIFRSNLIEERLRRAFEEGFVRVDTEGRAVGQINGLTVVDMVDHAFGHPVRITANVFMGQEGVVNIEREVKMTGPIHNKGLLTLQSYLGRKYAQDMPLSLSARIAFEQTYSGIEGDSASSTELYCLISALAGIPLRQDVAVTGSVDQFGNVQPIGGVNEKIEGFFRYCKSKGLTGTQGVMIPVQNVKNLMLHHEVVDAVREGKFHIWAVEHVDQGLELLTGVQAGSPGEDGTYPDGTVHGLVKETLKKMLDKLREFKKGSNNASASVGDDGDSGSGDEPVDVDDPAGSDDGEED
ncbi:MAG: AAA family ATPase [Thermanaerothrix sp.]|nr:AAA family ATPase [Thermanaerothrix sp.]